MTVTREEGERDNRGRAIKEHVGHIKDTWTKPKRVDLRVGGRDWWDK